MSNPLDGEIRNGKHHQPMRVYYEDTDFSGIVYHASYLRFMERGRTNYLRLIGADHRALFEAAEKEAPSFSFVVRHMGIDFKKPAFMDDVLDVVTTPEEVKGASVTLNQKVMRGEELIVEAHVQVAFVSGGRAKPIPKPLRVAMAADLELGGAPAERAHSRGHERILLCPVRHRDRRLRRGVERARHCRRATAGRKTPRRCGRALCGAMPARGKRRRRSTCSAPSTAWSRCSTASGAI